jgi:hypothetical protein
VLDQNDENLFLVYRTRFQIVKVPLHDPANQQPTEPGVLLHDPFMPDHLPGLPEDLIWLKGADQLAATFLPDDAISSQLVREAPGIYNDIVLLIDPVGNRIVDRIAIPDLCWINCIRRHTPTDTLYIGCEDRPELLVYDLNSRELIFQKAFPTVGDFQDIAFDDAATPHKLLTVSLWFNMKLSQLNGESLEIEKQVAIGGANYETAFSPKTRKIFISRFYESRVVIVDVDSFEKIGHLRTGFGTRALAIDEQLGVILASSIYDGKIRIFSLHDNSLLAKLQVGGHVKSIALDTKKGAAYFGSQCGLFRLDYKALLTDSKLQTL